MGTHVQEGRKGKFALDKGTLKDGPGGEVGGPGAQVLMVSGAGLDAGIGHAEGLDRFVHLPVEVDLPHIGVVAVDNPVGVVDSLDTVEGTHLRLDRDALINRGHALGLAGAEVLVQLIAPDILLRLPEAHTHAGPQAHVPTAGLFDDGIPGGLDQDGVGLAAQQGEAVVRSQDVDRLAGLDEAHVHLPQLLHGHLVKLVQCILPARIDHRGQLWKQFGQPEGTHAGQFGHAPFHQGWINTILGGFSGNGHNGGVLQILVAHGITSSPKSPDWWRPPGPAASGPRQNRSLGWHISA